MHLVERLFVKLLYPAIHVEKLNVWEWVVEQKAKGPECWAVRVGNALSSCTERDYHAGTVYSKMARSFDDALWGESTLRHIVS